MDQQQRQAAAPTQTNESSRRSGGGPGGLGNQGALSMLASGPFSDAANTALSDLFGSSLDGLDATLDPGAASALDADAYTEGTHMVFGALGASLFQGDTPDDEAMALAAHEVSHALAGGGSGGQQLDAPGDAGEQRADQAEQLMRQQSATGGSAKAPVAHGGGAQVHRRSTSGASFTGRPALRYGARSSQVRALQALLNRHGANLPTTGYFDNMTLSAVRDFQRRNGLGVDGIAGPATASALQRGGSGGSGGSGAASGWTGSPTLEFGMRSEQVRSLQTQLNARGAKLPTTGYFGNMTLAALQAFQRASGLAVDGKAGSATHRALQQSHTDARTEDDHRDTCSITGSPALKRGSRGPQVRELQTILNTQGERLSIDGIFGRGTEAAVKRFQQGQGLSVDGTVGPATARALASCSSGPATDDKETDGPIPAPTGPGTDATTDNSAGEVRDADPKSVLTSPNLHPEVRRMAGETVRGLQAEGLRPYVFEGYRSFQRQNNLYNSGRGVTKVRGGGSFHNYGLAVDIVFWNDRNTGPSWDNGNPWSRVGHYGKAAGFTQWGGDWGWDMPHLQYHPGHSGGAYDLLPAYNRGGLTGVWESLGTDLSTINGATTWDGVISGEIELRNGTTGEAVRTLQEKLNEAGAGISVDGQFGSGTEAAVKAFQTAQGIAASGVVDQETARRLA